MLITELGIVTETKVEQDEKALPPMLVTEFGIVTDVRFSQLLKAPSSISVTMYVSLLYEILLGIIRSPVGLIYSGQLPHGATTMALLPDRV